MQISTFLTNHNLAGSYKNKRLFCIYVIFWYYDKNKIITYDMTLFQNKRQDRLNAANALGSLNSAAIIQKKTV